MNDPHVERLIYDVITAGSVSYEKAAPGKWSVLDGRFIVSIEGATLTAEPAVHFASADEALAEIDPLIRNWEMRTNVQEGTTAIQFKFRNAKLIDRNPLPGVVHLEPATISFWVEVSCIVGRKEFRAPPASGNHDDATERMYRRLLQHWDHKDYFAADGYYMLTEIEERFSTPPSSTNRKTQPKRRTAASNLCIDDDVLAKLGELTSARGGPLARKAGQQYPFCTQEEREWIRRAMRILVKRALEYDAAPGGSFPQITLADLPNLPQRSGQSGP